MSSLETPNLLAIDWGSSTLRGALLGATGQVLAQVESAHGLLNLSVGGWPAAFDASFGAWRAQWPQLPALMSGMVGSRQGWVEAPYCPCPVDAGDLATGLLWLQPGTLAIVPGVSLEAAISNSDDARHQSPPDVMRGEETQVFGALDLLGLRDATLVLPGTHSKWVTVRAGRITGLRSFMTGECYALLRHQSILARGLPAQDSAHIGPAFEQGVRRARDEGGLLHHLFGVRTLGLFERLPPEAAPSYLSGLLIGEELRCMAVTPAAPLVLIGAPALTERYARALATQAVAVQKVHEQATWRGLWAIAQRLRA